MRVIPDPFGSGSVLEIDGAEQSHVDLDEPWEVRHEYVRRIAHVFDALWPALEPVSVLHLGAGALTIPRYVQATRPGSPQVAVDIAPAVFDLVLAELPLPPESRVECVAGDAREVLGALLEGTALSGSRGFRDFQGFRAIVVDIFAGRASAPPHVACAEFYGECLAALAPDGALLVNVGDDAGQDFLASQIGELNRALRAKVRTQRPGPAQSHWLGMLCDARVQAERCAGNVILIAAPGRPRLSEEVAALAPRGPHPAYAGPATLPRS